MRVFVAGATGVAGRRAVARLVAAGHEVTGIARSPEKAALLESLGARAGRVEPVRPGRAAGRGGRPRRGREPRDQDPARCARWRACRRGPRTSGSAGRRPGTSSTPRSPPGATVFVQESLAFMYGEHGDSGSTPNRRSWSDVAVHRARCASRRRTSHASPRRAAAASCCASGASTRRTATRRRRWCAPRAADCCSTSAAATATRRGSTPTTSRRRSSPRSTRRPASTTSSTTNRCTRAEQAAALAAAVGRRRLWRAPAWMTPKRASYLAASQRVSNARFRDATGWQPVVAERARRVPQARPRARASNPRCPAASG